jgi:hypothetical protein
MFLARPQAAQAAGRSLVLASASVFLWGNLEHNLFSERFLCLLGRTHRGSCYCISPLSPKGKGGFQRGQSPLSVAHIHARNEARLGPLLFAVAPCVALSVVSWSSIARARYRWLITQQRFCERQGFFLEILYFERKNPVFHPVRLLLNGRVPPSFLQGRRPRRPFLGRSDPSANREARRAEHEQGRPPIQRQ